MNEVAILDVGVPVVRSVPSPAVVAKAPRARSMPRARRDRGQGFLARVALWLDDWAARGCSGDTHCWAAKMETLRHIKTVRRP